MDPLTSEATKQGVTLIGKVMEFFLKNLRRTPKLKVITNPQSCYFQTCGGKQLLADVALFVTNRADIPLRFVDARLFLPASKGPAARFGLARRVEIRTESYITAYSETPAANTNAFGVHFSQRPAGVDELTPLRCKLVLRDQLGRRYVVHVDLRPLAKPAVPKEWHPEPLFSLATETEKCVVAILKEEIVAYVNHGRRNGGLGSLGTLTSVNPNTGQCYELLQLWATISASERPHFRAALELRLKHEGEYAPIAYLVGLVLCSCFGLQVALDAARGLEEGTHYSLSNMLAALEGLLQQSPESWSSDDLDELERFAHEKKSDFAGRITTAVGRIRTQRGQGRKSEPA